MSEEVVREIYDALCIDRDIIPLMIFLDGSQPIRLYSVKTNPPGTALYKVAWTDKFQVVYWKRGKPGKWSAVYNESIINRDGYELVGTFEPSILLKEDEQDWKSPPCKRGGIP